MIKAFSKHKLFYKGHWSKLIFTLIGLDGYLCYRIDTYFTVGEWFIGAIIIIYILYPLILWMMNKNIFIIHLLIIIGYYIMYQTNFFIIIKDINIITCINSFYFGVLLIKYKKTFIDNFYVKIISLFLFLLLYSIKISKFILLCQIQGFSLFIILVNLGRYILSKRKLKIINYINDISYSIFLYHHHVIFYILRKKNPTEWYLHIILLGITIILTLICSSIHYIIVNSAINSFIFRKSDSFFSDNK